MGAKAIARLGWPPAIQIVAEHSLEGAAVGGCFHLMANMRSNSVPESLILTLDA